MLVSLGFALSAILVAAAARPRGPVEAVLFFAPIFASGVLVAGYALSAANAIGQAEAWLTAGVLLAAACLALPVAGRAIAARRPGAAPLFPGRRALVQAARGWLLRAQSLAALATRGYRQLSTAEKRLLMPCLATAAILAVVNLDLALHTAPHNWDSMTYHLARMAYTLQHGTLASFDANYWAQVTHPKNATLLLVFTYLASGRNENLTQLVQFISYAVAALAVYGISRRVGSRRYASLFAAAVFALLTECLMQALTTQNDMLVTALSGCAVYGLAAWRQRPRPVYLALTALSAAIAVGVKSSALLVLPSLGVVALYAFGLLGAPHRPGRDALRAAAAAAGGLAAFSLVFAGLFVLPAGYVENWLIYGHPVGPEHVRKLHTFEGQSLGYMLDNGTKNALRFGFEFLSLDGLPPFGDIATVQAGLRRLPAELTRQLGLNLETTEATRAPFSYDKAPAAHEDQSYWGVFGFALLLPLGLALLAGWIRSAPGRILALACGVFWLAQACSGPYDPWRGRYFIIMAVFAAPALSCWIGRPHAWPARVYLTVVVLLGCFSGFAAVLGRANSIPEDVYRLDRIGQLTRNRPEYADPIRRFEQIVPPGATVAVWLGEDSFEYPLFGEKLSRTLIPVNGFYHGPSAIPPQADYLLYSSSSYPDRQPSDIHLGADWYLRVL